MKVDYWIYFLKRWSILIIIFAVLGVISSSYLIKPRYTNDISMEFKKTSTHLDGKKKEINLYYQTINNMDIYNRILTFKNDMPDSIRKNADKIQKNITIIQSPKDKNFMINLYIQISRATVDRFRETNGVFWDIYAPVVEGGLNLIISVMLIGKMGVLGILIGTLVSNIVIVLIWKPYTVYKYVFKMNISKYVINFLQCTLTAIVAIFISNFIRNFLLSIIGNSSIIVINFIINIIVSGLVITVVGTLLYLLQKDYRKLVKYILGIFLKK